MNYTRITYPRRKQFSTITEDIEVSSREPLFTLAERFEARRLKVMQQDFSSDKVIAFVITGSFKYERLIVFLEIDQSCNMVTRPIFQKAVAFDRELAKYLGLALLVRLKKAELYSFAPGILPMKK